jgi:hypothetical protein
MVRVYRKPCPVDGVISHAADLTSSAEATRVGNIIAGMILYTIPLGIWAILTHAFAEHLSKRTNSVVSIIHNAAMHGDDQANHKFNADLMQKSFALSVVSPGILTGCRPLLTNHLRVPRTFTFLQLHHICRRKIPSETFIINWHVLLVVLLSLPQQQSPSSNPPTISTSHGYLAVDIDRACRPLQHPPHPPAPSLSSFAQSFITMLPAVVVFGLRFGVHFACSLRPPTL